MSHSVEIPRVALSGVSGYGSIYYDALLNLHTRQRIRLVEIETFDTVCARIDTDTRVEIPCAYCHASDTNDDPELELRGKTGSLCRKIGECLTVERAGHEPEIVPVISAGNTQTRVFERVLEQIRGIAPEACSLEVARRHTPVINALQEYTAIQAIPRYYRRESPASSGTQSILCGINDALRQSFYTGFLFSELNLPWSFLPDTMSIPERPRPLPPESKPVTTSRRCFATTVATVAISTFIFLAGTPIIQAADDLLFQDDFENQFDTGSLSEKYYNPEKLNNQWTLAPSGGAAMSVGVDSPVGEVLPLISKTSFAGFRTHPVISVSVDMRVGTRSTDGRPFGLPTAVVLVSDSEDPKSVVASFSVSYLADTFGEDILYEVAANGSTPEFWNAAPALADFQETSGTTAGWFRWTAVFLSKPDSGEIQSTVSVASLGEDGSGSPQLLQKWEFAKATVAREKLELPLYFGVNGRGRDSLGVIAIDNVAIRSGARAE